MKYISMFSGIEAATVAWHHLGWEPLAFCEIEPFPSAVLARHYPNVPNLGDVTKADFNAVERPDLIVFGSPCQSFSVAGKRLGLDDPRGNLALYALGVVNRLRPRWFLFENVPGLLSSGDGRDFGAFLGTVGECGYSCSWRVLDAQYFGVPQRRRRVFVVGYLGDWRRAAAVLFERHSLQGHPPPSREAGEKSADRFGFSVTGSVTQRYGSKLGTDESCQGSVIAHTLRDDGFDASEDGTGRGTPLVPVAFAQNQLGEVRTGEVVNTLNTNANASGRNTPMIAFGWQNSASQGDSCSESVTPSLDKSKVPGVGVGSAVRRLTPTECERLQGFPEVQESYTILVCKTLSDHQKTNALAALQCRKLPSSVWSAGGGGWKLSAEAAAHHLSTSHQSPAPPVALDVLIDLERLEARLHSAARSFSLVANAGGKDACPLHIGIGNFALLGALLTHAWGLATTGGRAASQQSIKHSFPLWSGRSIAVGFGRETEERAADATSAIAAAIRLSTSTTLPSGLDTETLHLILTTLCCCVVHAIAGFIPETTNGASCFVVRLTTAQGYTLVPYRGKPAADGPRYKALGNSMAVPVMRWIGQRISMVSAIERRREIAA